MAHSGKIKSYDVAKGSGLITPVKGGDALPFNKTDLQQQAQEPRSGQDYGYETRQVNGGTTYATNMTHGSAQPEQSQGKQASKQQG